MSGIDMNDFYRILGETLQPLDVENLKFALADSFKGKVHWAFASISWLDRWQFEKWTL